MNLLLGVGCRSTVPSTIPPRLFDAEWHGSGTKTQLRTKLKSRIGCKPVSCAHRNAIPLKERSQPKHSAKGMPFQAAWKDAAIVRQRSSVFSPKATGRAALRRIRQKARDHALKPVSIGKLRAERDPENFAANLRPSEG